VPALTRHPNRNFRRPIFAGYDGIITHRHHLDRPMIDVAVNRPPPRLQPPASNAC
jgi:hypothetical protein